MSRKKVSSQQLDLFGDNLKKSYALSQDFMRLKKVRVASRNHKVKKITTISIAAIQVSAYSAGAVFAAMRSAIDACAVTAAQNAKELVEQNVLVATGIKEQHEQAAERLGSVEASAE